MREITVQSSFPKPKSKDALKVQRESDFGTDSGTQRVWGLLARSKHHVALTRQPDIWRVLTVHQVQDEAEFVRRVEGIGHADDEGAVLEWTNRSL